jgi:hypothetical protein
MRAWPFRRSVFARRQKGQMTASPKKSDGVLVADAAHRVTEKAGRYCGTDAVRKAAKRLGVYGIDEQGRGVIPEPVVNQMARNYAAMGYLIRRLQPTAELRDE